MSSLRVLITLTFAIIVCLAFGTDGNTRIVQFGFEKFEAGKYSSPEVPRSGLTAIVELKNGKVLKAPLVNGGREHQWYLSNAVFEEFDLAQANSFGLEDAAGNVFPGFMKLTGARVTAFTKSGARRVVELASEIARLKWAPRQGYKVLPLLGSSEAIIPWSEITISGKVRDGIEMSSSVIFQLESKTGETIDLPVDRRVDRTLFENNTTTVIRRRVPFFFDPKDAHRVRVRISGFQSGIDNDDIDFGSLKIESRGLSRAINTIFDSGGQSIKLGLKNADWWQSPIYNLREIEGSLSAKKIFFEIYTGADDLRVDGAEERTRSRISLLVQHNNTEQHTVSLPTLNQIRNSANFGANGTCADSFEMPQGRSFNSLNFIRLVPDLGQAGSGGLNFLGPDDWSFAGIRFWIVDNTNVRRVIYSNILNQRLSRNSAPLAVMGFIEQTKKVNSAAGGAKRDGLPGLAIN